MQMTKRYLSGAQRLHGGGARDVTNVRSCALKIRAVNLKVKTVEIAL